LKEKAVIKKKMRKSKGLSAGVCVASGDYLLGGGSLQPILLNLASKILTPSGVRIGFKNFV
jgi:hypothetical protein